MKTKYAELLIITIATLMLTGGCNEQGRREAGALVGAIMSGIDQTQQAQRMYQRPDWKPEDFFEDPQVIRLCHAIRSRDIAFIDRLIDEGVDVNAQGVGNMTPLLWAFVQGRPWNRPPTLAQQNQAGHTERWATAEFDATHLAIFTKLLENGADPNVQFTRTFFNVVSGIVPVEAHNSITRIAIDLLPIPYFEAVMQNGGHPHLFSDMNREQPTYVDSVVFRAWMAMDRADTLRKLQHVIDAGVDVNAIDDRGLTPLIHAVNNGSYDQAIILIESGADWLIAKPDNPDFLAPIVTLLTRWEFQQHLQNRGVQTPSYQRLIEILKERGANFELEREIMRHPLSRGTAGINRDLLGPMREELARLAQERREFYERMQQERMPDTTEAALASPPPSECPAKTNSNCISAVLPCSTCFPSYVMSAP